MPKRIQRKRTKGWRMPEGAMSVTRPGRFGNPFTVKQCHEAGYATKVNAARICVEAYRAWMLGEKHWAHAIPMPAPPDVSSLRGKDLACWCKPGDPCHADVLLEIANAEAR
jgi:hypothetical protein